jgi:hypothetical protein
MCLDEQSGERVYRKPMKSEDLTWNTFISCEEKWKGQDRRMRRSNQQEKSKKQL